MGTLWIELGPSSTFQIVKYQEERSGKGYQAAIDLIEKFIRYVRQGGQTGTGTLPNKKMLEYRFSTTDGQASNILNILQYSLTMCKQSPEKVSVHQGESSSIVMLGIIIIQDSIKRAYEPYISLQVQYNKASQTVRLSYFYNSQEWKGEK